LKWQYDWRGPTLQNLRLQVCSTCSDSPQEQLRTIVIPADPTPVTTPRPEDFVTSEAGSYTGRPYGLPTGLQQGAVMPQIGAVTYGALIPVMSVTANGTTTISVTCSQAHGLVTGAQISVEGLTKTGATGFYSINVTTGTAFNYTTFAAVSGGSLLTGNTRMVTTLVGLPYGYTTIPQVG
jgi:hypothetical protein